MAARQLAKSKIKTPEILSGVFKLWWVIVERSVTTYVFLEFMFVFVTFAV